MTRIVKSKHKEGRKRLTPFSRNENTSFFSKPYKPGQHKSKSKPSSTFGILLNEKQKLKTSYNLSEKKIKNIYRKISAKHKPAERVSEMMKVLSLKLDRVVFDCLFATSIYEAGQFVSHNHILVNQKTVNRKGFELSSGDVITLRGTDALKQKARELIAKYEGKIPTYLKLNLDTLSVEVLRKPDMQEVVNVAKIDISTAIQALAR